MRIIQGEKDAEAAVTASEKTVGPTSQVLNLSEKMAKINQDAKENEVLLRAKEA